MRLQLATSKERQPDFLELPFELALDDWPDALVTDIPKGVHRHPVRFVASDDGLFALKELPGELARHEWRLLRHLDDERIPAVKAVGVVSERVGGLDDVLITRHLDFSIPFRLMFAQPQAPASRDSLVDAIVVLLARLHLGGFFWGDCSLSNVLFRRDAGALSAFVVDVETAELHASLSDGQRQHDIEILLHNVVGGLSDLEAERGLVPGLDPVGVATALAARYVELWEELTAEDVVPEGERWRIDERLRRLNELGFDTAEIEVAQSGSDELRFRPAVVEAGHHHRRLARLTGIEAEENQARRLINDLCSYGAFLSNRDGRAVPEAVAAYHWLVDVYEPALAEIPDELRDRRDAAELFHEVLAHRDNMRDMTGEDVSVPTAANDYAQTTLPATTRERTLITDPD